MPRLIDATPIEKTDGWLDGIALVIPKQLIYDAPTVDAVPVVHGHWKFGCGGSYNGILQVDLWDCSRCGESCGYKSKYCPNCGAKMDEKEGKRNENCV